MNHPEQMGVKNLLLEFQNFHKTQYSGALDITTSNRHKFRFYYHQGSIVWATGGNHPHRRLRRHMAQHFPQIDLQSIQWRWQNLSINNWDYQLLKALHQKQKIQLSQVNIIVESTIAEILFDIIQQAHSTHVFCERRLEVILDSPMSFASIEISLQQVRQLWQNWSQAGLSRVSPNLAPCVNQPEQLQQEVNQSVYNHFITLINGKYTLRDIAVKMKQGVLPITNYLLPYIKKGQIQLREVTDWHLNINTATGTSVDTPLIKQTNLLVACVDDSPQVGRILGEMIIPNGLKFIHIQDSTKALEILIERKPNLIFLDLMMPCTNGYELCAQLRRISLFNQTPIIILTGSDGIFDRTRAKVVGSTDFITKPIVADKVMGILRKYLSVQSSVNKILEKPATVQV
ncbi:MAG: response regulator [Fischerella sp.]|jgi:chemotaxis family two-component system response regulator PixG|uniref:response regulator n=1 Tax=Fischerella sp. TaxID=1191 RepID=UPI00185368C5|nr:response regulator [Fischerella sp.]NWF61886.1 response regulator [Fischerella sp.]